MQPAVSIIIPCRNEERYISRCLDSLLANDYPHHLLDIVVVDGMSSDRTREIVGEYAQRFSCIRLLDNPDRIKPIALNRGIANTTADIVMRIDAHSIYASNYISLLVEGLTKYQCDNIGGIRRTDPGVDTWDRAIAHAISHPFAAGNAIYRTGATGAQPREVDTVFCGCYRRDVFERIGLFNEKLIRAQDREFNERLRQHGGKIILDPQVECTYFPRTNWLGYCRWTFQGAYWLFYASRFTETPMTSWRNWVPGSFVIWHALTLICFFVMPELALMMLFPIALYWVLNAFVSASAAVADQRIALFPYLMGLFAATHYGYGCGSICGWIVSRWHGCRPTNCSYDRLPELQRRAA